MRFAVTFRYLQMLMSFSLSWQVADAAQANAEGSVVFKSEKIMGQLIYFKKESSGCSTYLAFYELEEKVLFGYGFCSETATKPESSKEIVLSLDQIVQHYQLESIMRSRKTFSVKIAWKIIHWPLINAINSSSAWPTNFFSTLNEKYSNHSERFDSYIHMLQSEILKDEVYLPYLKYMNSYGCKFILNDYFSDPIPLSRFISKNEINELKIFNNVDIKKDAYPELRESITFYKDPEDCKIK